jgi:hypothetical protein
VDPFATDAALREFLALDPLSTHASCQPSPLPTPTEDCRLVSGYVPFDQAGAARLTLLGQSDEDSREGEFATCTSCAGSGKDSIGLSCLVCRGKSGKKHVIEVPPSSEQPLTDNEEEEERTPRPFSSLHAAALRNRSWRPWTGAKPMSSAGVSLAAAGGPAWTESSLKSRSVSSGRVGCCAALCLAPQRRRGCRPSSCRSTPWTRRCLCSRSAAGMPPESPLVRSLRGRSEA